MQKSETTATQLAHEQGRDVIETLARTLFRLKGLPEPDPPLLQKIVDTTVEAMREQLVSGEASLGAIIGGLLENLIAAAEDRDQTAWR